MQQPRTKWAWGVSAGSWPERKLLRFNLESGHKSGAHLNLDFIFTLTLWSAALAGLWSQKSCWFEIFNAIWKLISPQIKKEKENFSIHNKNSWQPLSFKKLQMPPRYSCVSSCHFPQWRPANQYHPNHFMEGKTETPTGSCSHSKLAQHCDRCFTKPQLG